MCGCYENCDMWHSVETVVRNKMMIYNNNDLFFKKPDSDVKDLQKSLFTKVQNSGGEHVHYITSPTLLPLTYVRHFLTVWQLKVVCKSCHCYIVHVGRLWYQPIFLFLITKALDKAKEAGRKERALCRQREQATHHDQINLDLTYSVSTMLCLILLKYLQSV